MRKNECLSTDNIYVGCKVKIGLPRIWCEVNDPHAVIWLKGKVTKVYPCREITNTDGTKEWTRFACNINCRWKKHHYYFKLTNLQCICGEDGKFHSIYLTK
jgi:hypothetical protein